MAVFELSYEGLNPGQKRLFRRLGLHPDEDFSAYAAAALNGTDVIQARRGLELYDHHLVDEPRFQRYLLHDLLHDYARGRAEDEERPVERAQAIERLVDYYTFVASRADQLINLLGHRDAYIEWTPASAPELISHTQAIEWMESERVNLHACVQLALEQGWQQVPRHVGLCATYTEFIGSSGTSCTSTSRNGPGRSWSCRSLDAAADLPAELRGAVLDLRRIPA